MSANFRAKTVSRQEPRRLRTRAALIQAGMDLLATRPIDAIPINDIVEQAGVAKGSFFNHFKDKDDFAAAVATQIREHVERQIDAANAAAQDPPARVVRGVCCFIRFALMDRKAARIMLRSYPFSGIDASDPLNAGLRADIAAAVRSGQFRIASEDAAILYVVGIAQMLLATVCARGLSQAEAKPLAAEVLTMLLTGLGLTPVAAHTTAQDVTQEFFA